ncbi:unnamed protein product [Brachionus calyciflorus]|uniref:RRM domain-containing protein n=1 Tax=Brachionus calyciflorus TaxID=104777 RepID=A0A813NQ30_9BILA|nr:unnamed protein product [Brachionus calyciflorus]
MSGPVIIRLQNLPLEARSIDIRKFFEGLLIPDGGVHIIGGERGDAFIAFQSDEDARLAMARDGNILCNAKIKLFLSSKNEMQSVITAARNQLAQLQTPVQVALTPSVQPITSVNPIEKILSNKTHSQQNPLDLLNSITKLFSKTPQESKVEQTQQSPSNISIKEILNILNTTNATTTGTIQKPVQNEPELPKPPKACLLPTPSPPQPQLSSQQVTQHSDKSISRRRHEEKVPEQKPVKTPLLPAPPSLEPIIKVKNFNPNCSYKDVRMFLQGIQIEHNGIKFINDSSSQGNKGQAFVRLVNIVDLKKALCRNGQYYEDRQIEVSQSSEAESTAFTQNTSNPKRINETPKSQNLPTTTTDSTSPSSGFFIKIYGLPARFDDTSLKNMFNNVKFNRIITANPTPIQSKVVNQDGQSETKTFMKAKKLCEVETQLDVERALTRQDERVGKSKIQIFQISKSEYERELSTIKNIDQQIDENYDDGGGSIESEDDEEDSHVILSGLPYSVRLDDIRAFFQGINPKDIVLLTDPDNSRPTGECLCEFYTKLDRDRALSKNDSVFRNRTIKVKPLPSYDYKQVLNQFTKKSKPVAKTPLLGAKPALLATPQSHSERPKPIHEFEESSNKRPYSNYSNYSSNKRVKQSSPTPPIDLPPLPTELQKYKNSIVLLSNVSYEATREDILELFKYYSPIEQTLKIRHDDRGQPTGDAIVACRSHDEASKACRSLNGVDFMGRNIRAVLISP